MRVLHSTAVCTRVVAHQRHRATAREQGHQQVRPLTTTQDQRPPTQRDSGFQQVVCHSCGEDTGQSTTGDPQLRQRHRPGASGEDEPRGRQPLDMAGADQQQALVAPPDAHHTQHEGHPALLARTHERRNRRMVELPHASGRRQPLDQNYWAVEREFRGAGQARQPSPDDDDRIRHGRSPRRRRRRGRRTPRRRAPCRTSGQPRPCRRNPGTAHQSPGFACEPPRPIGPAPHR